MPERKIPVGQIDHKSYPLAALVVIEATSVFMGVALPAAPGVPGVAAPALSALLGVVPPAGVPPDESGLPSPVPSSFGGVDDAPMPPPGPPDSSDIMPDSCLTCKMWQMMSVPRPPNCTEPRFVTCRLAARPHRHCPYRHLNTHISRYVNINAD